MTDWQSARGAEMTPDERAWILRKSAETAGRFDKPVIVHIGVGPLDIVLEDDGPFVRGEEFRVTCRGFKTTDTRLEEIVGIPEPDERPGLCARVIRGGWPEEIEHRRRRGRQVKNAAKRDPEKVKCGFPDPPPQGPNPIRHADAPLAKLSNASLMNVACCSIPRQDKTL